VSGSTRLAPMPLRVREVVRESPEAVSIIVDTPPATDMPPARPGQFNMLYVFGIGEAAISVSGMADSAGQVHTVRAVGAVSAALTRLAPGDRVGVRGPFGTGWPLDRAHGRDLVLISGGIGLAPLRPVLRAALAERDAFRRVVLLYGARSPDDRIFVDDLAAWQARRDVEVAVTVDYAGAGWRGRVGFVTALLAQARFDAPATAAMICGPEVMMRATATVLLRRGVSEESIYLSLERNMHCAVGFCGHCQLGPELVCRDGPVFAYPRVRDLLAVREI
jgi:NAD(P)H-flavin reductase